MSQQSDTYGAQNIDVMEGLEAVRKRPGMYIGSTGQRGLHHLVYEVVDNSIDEALAGYCDRIVVTLLADGGVRVVDNGRGIPVEENPKYPGRSALEIVLTELHAGGKFGGGGYKMSGGLHGVGVSVVNALSTRVVVDVMRDGAAWSMEFGHGGEPTGPLRRVGDSDETGTTVTFWADPTVFETTDYDAAVLARRLREMSFLNSGLRIVFVDERGEDGPVTTEFHAAGGLVDFVAHLNKGRDPLHGEVISFRDESARTDGAEAHRVSVAMQWTTSYQENLHSFANAINTHEGGTHEEGFRAALTTTLNKYAFAHNLLKEGKDDNLTGDDCREGLTAIVSVMLSEPQFEGQTKTKLGNTEMKGYVQSVTNKALADWLETHPGEARTIIEKAKLAAQGRLAAKKARELTRRKSVLDGGGLPGKLVDCTSKDPSESEIFIVEGDSAGGSAVKARDRTTQAILPIRGKILNVEKARLDKILANTEILALISAIGAGIGDEFKIEDVRYHKIVTLVDADVDGAHIRTLLLTFLFRYMPQLIEAGYVYAAQPPLYGQRIGNDVRYVHSDRELEALRAEHTDRKLPPAQRYKGLGEMDYEELWETTMDPAKRILRLVSIEDAAIADEVFSTLMGENVEVRKEFIRNNAADARFLDI
ncbi:MAG: DNA topoisomerase (ATP-hydrolyzing) subunit B [Acidimicrobiia bacterium]|nr:DNA topoisomerase (ATP-hydrolyzing) subunit B [Acidimicrobiia bacterium]